MEDTLSPRDRGLAIAALLFGGVAIGAAPILVRLAEDEGVGPSAIAFWRLLFAVAPLTLWAAIEPRRPASAASAKARDLWLLTVLAGFFFAADLVTWHAGIARTTAANATLLANLTPVVVALAAWLLFKERPTQMFVAALAVTLFGAALLSSAGLTGEQATNRAADRAMGDALSTLTAFWYAGYLLAVKAVRTAWSTARVMALTTALGVPMTLAPALILGENFLPETTAGWLWLAGLALICQVAGQSAIGYGLGRVPASLSSLVILIQPVVAALLAWLLFKEALGPIELAGGALVVVGIVMVRREARTR